MLKEKHMFAQLHLAHFLYKKAGESGRHGKVYMDFIEKGDANAGQCKHSLFHIYIYATGLYEAHAEVCIYVYMSAIWWADAQYPDADRYLKQQCSKKCCPPHET